MFPFFSLRQIVSLGLFGQASFINLKQLVSEQQRHVEVYLYRYGVQKCFLFLYLTPSDFGGLILFEPMLKHFVQPPKFFFTFQIH